MSDRAETCVVRDVVCPACCCLCDDVELTLRRAGDGANECDKVLDVRNACPRGRAWFLRPRSAPAFAARIEGRDATLDEAIRRAAALLQEARYPLVYILSEMSSEAQRLSAAIGDRIGAVVDTATSSGHAPSIMGFQVAGKVTCTLGETRNRADLIIFWGTNVLSTYPRFFTRYSAEAIGMFVPRGRADRTCFAIDMRENETSRACDGLFQIHRDADYEALNTLRALVRGLDVDAEQVERQTGVALARWQMLVDRMKQARFGSIVFGPGLMHSRGRHAVCEHLFRLVAELNDHTRFISRSIRGPGNITGGDKVLTWRTGFPFAINLARGFPRYNPVEYTAEAVLSRGEVDAALIVGGDPASRLSAAALKRLQAIGTVVIGSNSAPREHAQVAIPTATHALHTAGTIYRMDDIPLAARASLRSNLPSEVAVLMRLQEHIRAG